jgi:multidrug efflux pump subunit AcrA (membrane-fusion protein)
MFYWSYPVAQSQGRNKWTTWLVTGCFLAAAVAAILWFQRRPRLVTVVHPAPVSLTETIASSARVGGIKESAVGAQFSGTVEQLFVKAGDRVKAGQALATLKNNVTQQQKVQVQMAVQTARAKLAQASKPPLRSELDGALHQVTEAQAQAVQADADLQLAKKQAARSRQLMGQGLIAKSEFDTAEANLQSLEARAHTAKATVKVREAQLATLKSTPLAEDVQVARGQLAEAEQALQVAVHQTKDATVKAPFAGVVTVVNAELGQTVGSAGVVDLVSDSLEIRVDLDESNLADLELGQSAILSSSTFGDKSFQGRLTDIGAAVDQTRGIVTVKITPDNPPDWLRPGQTINVNLVTNEKVDRLVVPSEVVLRQGSRSIVLVVQDGRAIEKIVLTRPTIAQGIPIAGGLTVGDEVIVNPSGISPGEAVRVQRRRE